MSGAVLHSRHGYTQPKQTPAKLPMFGGHDSRHLLLNKKLSLLSYLHDVQVFLSPVQVAHLSEQAKHWLPS